MRIHFGKLKELFVYKNDAFTIHLGYIVISEIIILVMDTIKIKFCNKIEGALLKLIGYNYEHRKRNHQYIFYYFDQ